MTQLVGTVAPGESLPVSPGRSIPITPELEARYFTMREGLTPAKWKSKRRYGFRPVPGKTDVKYGKCAPLRQK
jgi:hypothetical protein